MPRIGVLLSLTSLLLPLARPCAADPLDDARGNMETLVRTFVNDHSKGGWWTLKDKKTGAPLRLKLESFDEGSVRSVGGTVYGGIAVLREQGGRKRYADFRADFGSLWTLKGMKLLSDADADSILGKARFDSAKAAHRAEQRAATRAKRKSGPLGTLPDVVLPTLGGGGSSPADCEGAKCVVVYVAPWCPHCQASTNDILEMRKLLKPRGIGVKIIVGMDDEDKVSEYAAKFGPETLLDPGETCKTGNGVPNFSVVEDGGGVFLKRAGAPEGEGGQALAEYLGL